MKQLVNSCQELWEEFRTAEMVWEEPRRAQNWWPQLKVVRQGKMRRNSQNRVFEDVRIHSSSYRQNLSCNPIVQHSLLLETSATRPVRVLLASIISSIILLLLLLFLFPLTSSSCLFLLYLHWMDILPRSGYDWTFYWRFIQAVARAEWHGQSKRKKGTFDPTGTSTKMPKVPWKPGKY